MKFLGLALVILNLSGCASLYSKDSVERGERLAYHFGCLDSYWKVQLSKGCKFDNEQCQEGAEKLCAAQDQIFRVFLRESACLFQNTNECFKN